MEESDDNESEKGSILLSKMVGTDSIQSEGLNFISGPPTLQSIAVVHITIRLWTEEDVMEILLQGYGYSKLEERVLDKLNKSSIPHLFQSEISKHIRPIGQQLLKWFDEKNQEYCSLRDLRIMNGRIHWTMDGTIDKVKTLEELITNDYPNKPFCCLYCLACKYCLEEYIFDLWEMLSSKSQKEIESIFIDSEYENDLIAYWTFIATNELSGLLEMFEMNSGNIYHRYFNLNENMISWSIFVGNPFALKYFWRKLTEEEKNARIYMWLKMAAEKCNKSYWAPLKYNYLDYNSYTENFYFLLFQVRDQDMQKKYLRNNVYKVLNPLFRSWPFQKFFVSTTVLFMDHMNGDEYLSVLRDIIEEMETEKSTRKIFSEIWSSTPPKLKCIFLEENVLYLNQKFPIVSSLVRVILKFLKIGDPYNALRLVKDASTTKKKWITSSVTRSGDFYNYVYNKNDLSLLDILFKALLPPNMDLQSFKEGIAFSYTQLGICMEWRSMGDVQAVDVFLAWAFQSEKEIQDFKQKYVDSFHGTYSIAKQVHDVYNLRFETGAEIIRFRTQLLCRRE